MLRRHQLRIIRTEDPDFGEGVRLFNERRYFEAHEAWELVWRRTPAGVEREVLQGLIQIAAACHHLVKGNPAGVQGCLENARGHLGSHLGQVAEFDLPAVLQAVEQASAGMDPALLPMLTVGE